MTIKKLLILGRALGFIAMIFGIPGCAMLTRPMEMPVIEDNLRTNTFQNSRMGILSLSPERRAVLYNFESDRYCAENPTEVGIDMASAAKLAASLKGPSEKTAVEAAAAMSAASNSFVLNRRSQGIILYQASSYQFCQMYANKAINEVQFKEMQLAALAVAKEVLLAEISAVETIRDPEPNNVSAENSRSLIESRAQLLTKPDKASPEEVKPSSADKNIEIPTTN